MSQNNEWKSKYQELARELDDKESDWKKMEDILRGAISRLSIAGRGIDNKLDDKLREIQNLSRSKQDQKLGDALEQLSRIITSLEDGNEGAPSVSKSTNSEAGETGPTALLTQLLKNIQLEASQQTELKRAGEDLLKAVAGSENNTNINQHIKKFSAVINRAAHNNQNVSTIVDKDNTAVEEDKTAEVVFQLIRLLGLDSSSQQRIDKQIADHKTLSEQELQRIADTIREQLSVPEEDSKSIGEVITILLERLAILPGTNDAVQTIQNRVLKGIDHDQWPEILNELADIVSGALSKVNEEKRRLESFIANVTEQLGEITRSITEDHEDGLSSHRETLSLQKLVQKRMSSMEQNVSSANDIDQLKSEISENIKLIRVGLEDFVDRAKSRQKTIETRNNILSSQISQMEKETEQLQQKLSENRQKLLYDALTGARSRLAYDEHMEQELARWKRYGSTFTYVILDIDYFKKVNDSYGHNAGDKALKIIAQLMLKQIRDADFLFRIGGEEFVLLLSNTNVDAADPLVTKLREAVQESSFHYKQKKIVLTLSAGLTEPNHNDDIEAIYKRADAALYRAKNSGRNSQIVA